MLKPMIALHTQASKLFRYEIISQVSMSMSEYVILVKSLRRPNKNERENYTKEILGRMI